MTHELITSDRQLQQLCRELADEPVIAFDTEFVSEHTYRPELCLIQVAAGERLAVIDPLAGANPRPFWELLAGQRGQETIVHAGREELFFCLGTAGGRPTALFDVQIAAGLVGLEYPAGYGSLMFKLLGERADKGETRTDWRRRPLTERQIEYALDDVRHLRAMRDELQTRLAQLGRLEWMQTEMLAWQSDVEATRGDDRWRRVSGISSLAPRSLAVVRELWRWRESEAERRDCPIKRVLRDDLIVELSKRRSADPKLIRAIRGMERGDLQRLLPGIAQAIERGLALADDECPAPAQREMPQQLTVLGQFLSSALGGICRSARVAPSMVGTASDVRDLIAYHLGLSPDGDPPVLNRGWRAEVVGRRIEDLLAGKLAIRIRDPLADEPLAFEP